MYLNIMKTGFSIFSLMVFLFMVFYVIGTVKPIVGSLLWTASLFFIAGMYLTVQEFVTLPKEEANQKIKEMIKDIVLKSTLIYIFNVEFLSETLSFYTEGYTIKTFLINLTSYTMANFIIRGIYYLYKYFKSR